MLKEAEKNLTRKRGIHLRLCDYLNASEIYNENGLQAGGPNLDPPYPELIGVPIPEDDPAYSGYVFTREPPLQIVRNGWKYESIHSGINNFIIYVKPEVDVDGSLTRLYVLSVILGE